MGGGGRADARGTERQSGPWAEGGLDVPLNCRKDLCQVVLLLLAHLVFFVG